MTLGAKAGEVLLVNRDRSSTTVAARSVTTASTSTATTATAATATATGTVAAGSLDKASVNVEEGLLLALLGGLGALLLLALDVCVVLLATLQFLGAGPLVVGALVGSTDGLGAEVTLGSLLGKVVGERLGLVGGLLGLLLGGSLGLILLSLGQLLTGLLVVEFLLAALATPALVDLLAGVARNILLVASVFTLLLSAIPVEVVVLLRYTTAVLAVIAAPSATVITSVESASLRLVALISRPVTVVADAGVAVTVSWTHPLVSRSESHEPHGQVIIDIPASLPWKRAPPRRLLVPSARGWEGASLGASRLPTRSPVFSMAFVGGAGGLLGSSSGSLPNRRRSQMLAKANIDQ